MNYYGLQLHKFILGERRAEDDLWESDWKRDLKRGMAEDALKPRHVVKVPQIVKVPKVKIRKERQPRGPQKPRTKRIERPSKWGIPSGSSPKEYGRVVRKIWRDSGLCGSCGEAAMEGRYSCASCIERKARLYCKRVGKEYVPKAILQSFCKECKALLNANNVYGYCSAHYKEKRRSLARAA